MRCVQSDPVIPALLVHASEDKMPSLMVTVVSSGFHYIGTSLEKQDSSAGRKGNKRPAAYAQVNQSGKQPL